MSAEKVAFLQNVQYFLLVKFIAKLLDDGLSMVSNSR